MKSTGEVLGIDKTFEDALLKGLVGAGYSLRQPTPGKCVILTVKDADKRELVDIAWQLKDMGYKLYARPARRTIWARTWWPATKCASSAKRGPISWICSRAGLWTM